MELAELLEEHGKLFSQELGIDLKKDPFRWFLASILFGARISTTAFFTSSSLLYI